MNNLVKIKFCGMSKKKDIEIALKLGVDWIGIIYVKTSPRYVDFKKSDSLINEFKGMINFVGVFVDADDMLIRRAVNSGINSIQLHGKEDPKRCKELRNNFNLPVIKAFSISKESDLVKVRRYKNCCDMILLDSKEFKREKNPGGNGRSFDWNIIKDNESWLNKFKPWILSGGLNNENIIEALNLTKAKAIDISSGIEKNYGKKNIDLMEKFIFKVRKLKM